jgi:hypothetical protein
MNVKLFDRAIINHHQKAMEFTGDILESQTHVLP